jgi:8-oxo-dGTP diphosphatase
MKPLRVAAGILCDSAGRVLITERCGDGPFKGLWEFPGGKIDAGESAVDALIRELAEELNISATASEPFMSVHHEYPDRTVDLEFFRVTAWLGEPEGMQDQGLRWLLPSDLNPDMLLAADKPVVKALQSS